MLDASSKWEHIYLGLCCTSSPVPLTPRWLVGYSLLKYSVQNTDWLKKLPEELQWESFIWQVFSLKGRYGVLCREIYCLWSDVHVLVQSFGGYSYKLWFQMTDIMDCLFCFAALLDFSVWEIKESPHNLSFCSRCINWKWKTKQNSIRCVERLLWVSPEKWGLSGVIVLVALTMFNQVYHGFMVNMYCIGVVQRRRVLLMPHQERDHRGPLCFCHLAFFLISVTRRSPATHLIFVWEHLCSRPRLIWCFIVLKRLQTAPAATS